MGWTPLHLACYFGHAVVVEDLLKVYFYLFLCEGRKFFVLEAVNIQVFVIEERQLCGDTESLLQFICM